MRKHTLAAAIAAAALFGLTASAATAQNVVDAETYAVDPAVVHPGAAELRPPMAALGSEYATPTQYAPDGEVGVPWGAWFAQLVNGLGLLVAGFVLWVLRKLPESVVSALDGAARMFNQGSANQLLEKAVKYGINVTAGAAEGKRLNLKVGNEVLERAFEYAIEKAPMFVRFVLGVLNVRGMIIARLDLEEDAALPATRGVADSLAVSRPPVEPPPPPRPARPTPA